MIFESIPPWVFLGLGSSALSAFVLLTQEKFKADGFALAFWNKATCAVLMVPFLFTYGLPDNPVFYMLVAANAVLWAISDVIFFRAIPIVGAGTVSRILPAAVILTFICWFIFDPALFHTYLQTPVRFGLIFLVLCLSTYFAMRIKNCPLSWQAVRLIWFVIFAATAGPIAMKLITQQSPMSQGPFAYVFVEAVFMMTLWGIYYMFRRPVLAGVMTSALSLKAGATVGAISAVMIGMNVMAIYHTDNPAYLPAIKFLDAIFILWVYRWMGKKEDADIVAGLGIVGCAAALVILKSLG